MGDAPEMVPIVTGGNEVQNNIAPIAFGNGTTVGLAKSDGVDDDAEGDHQPGTTSTYVDEEEDVQEEKKANESDDELWNDEQYAKVKLFFERELLVVRSLRIQYFKLCVQNGFDTLEKLKGVSRQQLMDIGVDLLDVGTMMIK